MNRTFRLLRADEIDVRVGQASRDDATRPWYSLLLYKDARADMIILDETVGAANWNRKHDVINNILYCTVGVRFPNFRFITDPKTGELIKDDKGNPKREFVGYGDFVYKQDCGTESNTEAEKGASSDSFKRACVNWGIGRELYTSPKMFISEQLKGVGDKRSLFVSEINYDDLGNIANVTIKDSRDPAFTKTFGNR